MILCMYTTRGGNKSMRLFDTLTGFKTECLTRDDLHVDMLSSPREGGPFHACMHAFARMIFREETIVPVFTS